MQKLLRSLHHRLGLRGWIALGLLVAVVAALPAVLHSPVVAEQRASLALKRARAHLAAREIVAARSEFQAALRLRPGEPTARRELAALELGQGNDELAFLDFQAQTEMHPEDPEGWMGLAVLMLKAGLLEAPEAALDNAIEATGERADARVRRSEIRFRLGRYDGALQDARAAVATTPRDPVAWSLLVRSTARAEGVEAGVEAARKAVSAVGEPSVLPLLACLLGQTGHATDARALLEKEATDAPAGSDRAWAARLALARLELGADRFPEAARQAQALLGDRPKDQEALALAGVTDARAGQVDAAVARLDAALASSPGSRRLLELRDRLQRSRTDSHALQALAMETSAFALGPPPAPPRRLRPDAQMDRGALGAWTREHWPGRVSEFRKTFDAQLQQRDWAEAQKTLDAASRDFPGSTFAPYLAGLLDFARGNLDEAERQLTEAMALAPRSPTIVGALGRVWSRKGGAAYAAGQLMALAGRDPGFPLVRYMAARAYIEAGDPPRAEGALRRGLELQPDSPVPYQHLTDYYFGLDRAAEALDVSRQGVARFPRSTDLQMMLAQIEGIVGHRREAMQTFEALTARRPDLDLALYKLAMLLSSEPGEPARQQFLAALRRLQGDRPADPQLLDALGWMHHRAGDQVRARALLEAAVEQSPEDPGPRYHLARVYLEAKENVLARQELKRALDSPRAFPERLEALRLLRQGDPVAPANGRASTKPTNH